MEILARISNQEARKKILESVTEAVKLRRQIESTKVDIAGISSFLKDLYDIPTAEFNKVVDTIYKENLDEQKDKVTKLEEVITLLKGTGSTVECSSDEDTGSQDD